MKTFFTLLFIMLALVPFGLSIYGLILAFQAGIVLGVLVFIVEPAPFILGLIALFGHADVAQKIADWVGLS